MAHFAEIGNNNKVIRVIVINNDVLLDKNGIEQESKGREFCEKNLGGTWVQTSYNGKFRKNYAGIGYTYNDELDAFIPPKYFESWILDETTCTWLPPSPYPNDEKTYFWNEETKNWEL